MADLCNANASLCRRWGHIWGQISSTLFRHTQIANHIFHSMSPPDAIPSPRAPGEDITYAAGPLSSERVHAKGTSLAAPIAISSVQAEDIARVRISVQTNIRRLSETVKIVLRTLFRTSQLTDPSLDPCSFKLLRARRIVEVDMCQGAVGRCLP